MKLIKVCDLDKCNLAPRNASVDLSEWQFEGPKLLANGLTACITVSPQNLGFQYDNSQRYVMAFLGLELASNEFGKKLLANNGGRGFLITSGGYKYNAKFELIGKRGLSISSADSNFLNSLMSSDYLQVKFTEEFDLLSQNHVIQSDLTYSLKGSRTALERVLGCF